MRISDWSSYVCSSDLAYDPEPWALALRGLDRSAFLAAFILLMALLREGGITSPAVLTCGTYVAQQPPQWRFLAVFLGSHFFSVPINLGSLSLLAPIIQRSDARRGGKECVRKCR